MQTQEGKNLPVEHCIKDTDGWQICNELKPYVNEALDKITFGSVDLPEMLLNFDEEIGEIELCGLCTDICVISNAMIEETNSLLKDATCELPVCDIVSVKDLSLKNDGIHFTSESYRELGKRYFAKYKILCDNFR